MNTELQQRPEATGPAAAASLDELTSAATPYTSRLISLKHTEHTGDVASVEINIGRDKYLLVNSEGEGETQRTFLFKVYALNRSYHWPIVSMLRWFYGSY
jgi:hypothetical protein